MSEQYVTPLLPRLVTVKLRTDQPPQAIFDYYDRRLRASGWANASFALTFSGLPVGRAILPANPPSSGF